ncbi:MAG: bifunctional [glutamate--ammonia ligase]-adenylyl-L-tyrosine phosphorylase/[glutamate--ammonia-ligase] adenylyltransferase [Gammaproteobacteria bacterium]|jgi:glutamate-ammonia-ligase adenylyltransferase|nr:bifunctional [glutamate--ammonia ligase]-adenylyl-L-tyrosine phosphorylase/[glutamate--ammonia-ligase] adenylyltransferase [Gammaproteobacteria bacterium]
MSEPLTNAPFPLLEPELRCAREALEPSLSPQLTQLQADPVLGPQLDKVLSCSPFFVESCRRYPELLIQLVESGNLARPMRPELLAQELEELLGETPDEAGAMTVLRRIRRREWMRLAWREISASADVMESLAELTDAADILIRSAMNFAGKGLQARHGCPRDAEGKLQQMIILGMGKLGGGELNFSSDIDLVFLYPEAGETDGKRSLSNELYFTRLGQALIRMLDQKTADGFVFRVDMRLRPFGDSGPLVCTEAAFENYLQQHGRDWERYAYVKARALSGQDAGEMLRKHVLRPFVFRKYLDYGVFESLRSMKGMIEREVERRELHGNVKLGSGGIREIEFIAQVFQLLRGGSVRALQERSLVTVLTRLVELGMLKRELGEGLLDSYRFLRRLENLLQARADEQTHDLPTSDLERSRLAFGLGCRDWHDLAARIQTHREFVQGCFETVVLGGDARSEESAVEPLDGLWDGTIGGRAASELLGSMGLQSAEEILHILSGLREGNLYKRLDETGRQRLDTLVPRVLRAVSALGNPARALARVVGVLQSVGRRSAYFALLNENPGALERLAHVCGRSDMLARQVAEHPLLLDELLDPRIFETPPDRAQMELDLAQRFAGQDSDDEEAQAEALRQFQRAAVFRIALADLGGVLPLMKISDRLTELAELILARALSLAWKQMCERYGLPGFTENGVRKKAGFAVVGYGKLGGLELGYSSDLDLVFLHDSRAEAQVTDGERSISNDVFFSRLATRLVNLIGMPTTSGVLYEVDMRLRPSGNAGLLVGSLVAFERYQVQEAWTWEHQALLRSRAVAGTDHVRAEFEQVRRRVLTEHVRRESLRQEVADMRARMRAELSAGSDEILDLKQDPGCIADIEFLVQYLVLANARRFPELLTFSDNIRQLEGLVTAGVMGEEDALGLKQAYLAFRGALHEASLAGKKGLVDAGMLQAERELVQRCWRQFMVAE